MIRNTHNFEHFSLFVFSGNQDKNNTLFEESAEPGLREKVEHIQRRLEENRLRRKLRRDTMGPYTHCNRQKFNSQSDTVNQRQSHGHPEQLLDVSESVSMNSSGFAQKVPATVEQDSLAV